MLLRQASKSSHIPFRAIYFSQLQRQSTIGLPQTQNYESYQELNQKQQQQKQHVNINDIIADENKPGIQDSQNFKLDGSVLEWQNRGVPQQGQVMSNESGPNLQTPEGARKFSEVMFENLKSAQMFQDQQSIQYWTYHILKMSYFITINAAAFFNTRLKFRRENIQSSEGFFSATSKINKVAERVFLGPVTEAINSFKQDLQNIQNGYYKLPWDMTTHKHRQFSPRFVLQSSIKSISEAVNVLTRRNLEQEEPLWLKSNLYPEYYQNTYHFQTDGWMSSNSASVYEASTEMIFFGRQDAMQRHTLIPIKKWIDSTGRNPRDLQALEVAAGTGRFATFFKDNYPETFLSISELSPYYLEEARKNIMYWHNTTKQDNFGGYKNTGTSFVQAAAEQLPLQDESQDIIMCIYLFHEIPESARNQAIKEFARILRPGGILVVTDSTQLGDRPRYDQGMGLFQKFNEPFYQNYIQYNFGEAFKEAGLDCDMKLMCSFTKVLSATKPVVIQP